MIKLHNAANIAEILLSTIQTHTHTHIYNFNVGPKLNTGATYKQILEPWHSIFPSISNVPPAKSQISLRTHAV